MKIGLHEIELAGLTLRIRVESNHSPDCSDVLHPEGFHWVEDGAKWLDRRGGNRAHHRRWQVYRCNGVSSAKWGDHQHLCVARVLLDGFGLSDVLNAALYGKRYRQMLKET